MVVSVHNLAELKGKAEVEYRERKKNGEYFWVSNRMSITYDDSGRPLYRNSVISDINERKKAEELIKQSEAKFRMVLESSIDVINRFNLRTRRIEYISPSWLGLSGYTPEEFISMDIPAMRDLVHPDDMATLDAAHALAEKEGNAEVEYRQRKKNGDWVWVSNRISVTYDDSGKPLYRNSNLREYR